MNAPTVALVLETNNLRAESFDRQSAFETLRTLLVLLRKQAPLLDNVIIPHDGLIESEQRELIRALDAPIQFIEIESSIDYYEAKNIGFSATNADIVIFGDADCMPSANWIAELILPFSDPSIAVVAGKTTYGQGVFGEAMTAVDFLYFDSPLGPGLTRNFYANNVAFRREVFARHRFPAAATLQHGQCALLAFALLAEGTGVRLAPKALTTHRLTPSLSEWFALRLARGADADELAPRLLGAAIGAPGRQIKLGSIGAMLVLGARLVRSLRECGDRRGHFRRAAVVGITAIDLAGAIAHSAGQRPRHENVGREP